MTRSLLCAIALICTASSGLACNAHAQQNQSCAEGTFWDTASQSCVKIVDS